MAVSTITHVQIVDNYAVVQLLTNDGIAVGSSVTVAGQDATFNGTYSVWALPQYLYTGIDNVGDLLFNYEVALPNQVLFVKVAANVARKAATTGAALTFTPVCTWIVSADIESWLGISVATVEDQSFITICAAASNQVAYNKRAESGYVDSLTTVPSQAVKLGTISLGAFYYRQRGGITDFPGLDGMGGGGSFGISPAIKMLLGIPRPAVA